METALRITDQPITLQIASRSNIRYTKKSFFLEDAYAEMKSGLIPNFDDLYHDFLALKPKSGELLPAFKLLPALRNFKLSKKDIDQLMCSPKHKHILAQNEQVKIMVIRWQPGDASDIHGHAIGGGLIKVVHGEIKEKRFSADKRQDLLSESRYCTGHIAYIDDVMGLHSVSNVNPNPALTLHIYTPGIYEVKKYN